VLDLAPDALFFNYSNPMAPVCRAISKATGAQVVGLCHGVFDVSRYLAEALGVPHSRFHYTAVGINHLTWFVEARIDGKDAMPRLREIAARKIARYLPDAGLETRSAEAETADQKAEPTKDHPFSWHLMRLFGAFPAVLDRHVSEFFPQCFAKGEYYGKTLGVDAFSFENTIAGGDRIYEQMRDWALSPDPLPPDYFQRSGGEHEQVTDIIESIRSEQGHIYSANLPNTGQVPNLPSEVIVESPAVADGAGLRAIQQQPLPACIVGTLATRYQWVETIVEAALEGSREKFIQALVLDGAVSSLEMATRLADDLLAAHAPYLPPMRP
jgi:alpha-galactosidase